MGRQHNLIGKSFSNYKIIEKIGEGGMGEVYKAEDSTLKREVAVKVLPANLLDDPERLARFEREAQVLASLNHSNIASIYGFEQSEGSRCLIMELIEGEDLSERIKRGALSVEEAKSIALQIAQALEVAHESGIVHRDLKPANIKLRPDGQVKVLDFGLAKAVEGSSKESDLQLSGSPTITGMMTGANVILGTAGYMSPEQARGQEVDKRADIWAFGCVLLEMLSGKMVFQGETISDTLASILKSEPDWESLSDKTPKYLRKLLERCLTKDPTQRLRDIGEARIMLEAGEQETESLSEAPAAKSGGVPVWVAGLLGLLVIAAAGATWVLRTPPPAHEIHGALVLPEGHRLMLGSGGHLAFSPDGTQLAYATVDANDVRSLWIKNMSDAESHQLSGTNNAINPFWSPDGNHLGFFAEGKLKRLPVSGGAPTVICDAPSGRGGHWATQETIHFAPRFNSQIMRVSASGGEPVPQTAPVAASSHRWPQLIPGKGLLFTHASQGEHLVFQAEGDSARVLVSSATQGNFANGELFYVVANVLFSRPFDPDKGSFVGEPQTIATGVYQSSQYLRAAFSVSNNGAIAYVPGDRDEGFNLVKTGLDGTVLQTQEMGGFASDPHLSPDGTRLAISRSSTTGDDQFNIWVIDLVRDIPTRITKTENVADDPVWAPDGRQLGYANGGNIEVVSASGVGESVQISNTEFDDCLHDWSSDGRYLVWSRATESGMSLVSYDFQTSEERVLVSGDNFVHAQFSPDLRWLAYTSRDSGEPQVYVQDFPELSDRWQISGAGGAYPQWDGNDRMVYLGRDGRLRSVALTGTDTGLDIGQEVVHAECPVGLDRSIRIALDPDGQSLWRIESQDEIEGDPEPIRFILNRRSE